MERSGESVWLAQTFPEEGHHYKPSTFFGAALCSGNPQAKLGSDPDPRVKVYIGMIILFASLLSLELTT